MSGASTTQSGDSTHFFQFLVGKMIFVGDGALLQQAVSSALSRTYKIDCVFGNSDRTAEFCRQHSVLFELAASLNEAAERISSICTDGIGFSIDNALILQPRLLDSACISFFGVHSGIIPFQRGNPMVAAIFAILLGSKEYGVTLFKLNAEIDAGEVLAIKRFTITPRSRLHEIVVTSAILGQAIFEEHLDQIVEGRYKTELISMANTRPYSLRDLAKLQDYCNHADFDRATDLGVLDGLLPEDQLALIADLRKRRHSTQAMPVRPTRWEQHLSYWKQRLSNVPGLQLPTRRERSPVVSGMGKQYSFRLGESLAEQVKAFAQTQRAPEGAVLLAAFYALLARYTGLRDLCVGSVIGQGEAQHPGIAESRVSNIVPLRADLSGRPSCAELLFQVRKLCEQARQHANVPFEGLRSALPLQAGFRLFEVSFQTHETTVAETPATASNVQQAWMLWQSGEHFDGIIEYDPALFDEPMVVRLASHYTNLLGEMLAHPDRSVFELEIVTPVERQIILDKWNATRVEYVTDRCVHQLIEEQAERSPDAVAAIGPGGERFSYHEVNARANRLARCLVSQGVKPEARVGICVERGVDMIVSILAVMKAGGAFVPIDPAYPAERIGFMLEDADVHLLLTTQSLVSRFRTGSLSHLVLEASTLSSALHALPTNDLSSPVVPNHLAYVIYTSGSTGRPKGVLVEHRSVHNTFAATQCAHPMEANDRFLSLASFGSDTAVWQLLGPLCWGACVVLNKHAADPSDILCCIDKHEVTTVELVPSLLRAVLEEVDRGTRSTRSLKTLISSGEPLTSSLLEHASASLPHCAVFNQYGPTESASQVTYHRCHPGKPVSIGGPLGHTRIYILSPEAKVVPVGVVGEIVIGGVAVARGYLNQPELTEKKFVPDPFARDTGARMYKTGDLGRYLENGEIEFLGRLDQQVKIRGHRVELGEIENVLRRFPGVSDAIVLFADEQSANPRLIGYLIVNVNGNGSGTSRIFLDRLREHVRQQLPAHMVPAVIVPLQQWPMTPHGKVDRKALSDVGTVHARISSDRVPPRNEVERRMANIWADVLGADSVGMHETFLELGGHSLLAVRLIAEVRAAFNVNLSLASVFELPTVELMAAFVSSGQTRKLYTPRPTREILLADAILPPEIVATEGRVLAVNGDVLLTGATGFLGRHLLLVLLQRTDARIHCLVRASSRDLAKRRIRAALQPTGADIANDRLNVIVGDLTLPVFGLSSEVWSLLSSRVAAIYHLGGMVNHVASYNLLRAANVNGTLEVLRLATSGPSKAVHFVSSVDVVDSQVANNVLLCDEPPLHVDPYTSSKWVADQLVAKADACGVPVCIYRIGYIGPHSRSGNANPSGWFELYLQAMLKIRSIPADANEFSLTPVDLIVDSIFELSRNPTSLHRAFHLLDRELTVSPMTLVAQARSLGFVLEVIPGKAWRERLGSYCAAHPDDPVAVLGPYLDALSAQGSAERRTHRPVELTCAPAPCLQTFDLHPAAPLRAFLRRTAMESEGVPSSANGLLA